jgi:Flp pilus assembly pilin Flp
MEFIVLAAIGALALVGIGASVVETIRDGYGPIPTRRA